MKNILTLLLFSLTSMACAQESNTGNWIMYFGNQKIGDRWNWHNEFQYRSYNFFGDLDQLLLRTGIGYNLTENNNNVLLGYAFVHSKPYINGTDEKGDTYENRIFQQFITRQNFGRFYLQHRYRFEQRFFKDDFKLRLRYFFHLSAPINKPTMTEKAVYLAFSNEIFLQPTSPVFDRDRIGGYIGYMIKNHLKFETGYLMQLYEKSSRGQFQIAFYNNLPIYKEIRE